MKKGEPSWVLKVYARGMISRIYGFLWHRCLQALNYAKVNPGFLACQVVCLKFYLVRVKKPRDADSEADQCSGYLDCERS